MWNQFMPVVPCSLVVDFLIYCVFHQPKNPCLNITLGNESHDLLGVTDSW